jgi:hypothetical protein
MVFLIGNNMTAANKAVKTSSLQTDSLIAQEVENIVSGSGANPQ